MQYFRSSHNPILQPVPTNSWESKAVFNGSVILENNIYRMVYRALSDTTELNGKKLQVSTVGYADGVSHDSFTNRRQLITPDTPWDRFGCEDPRITKIDGEYFIFYTALSDYPFYPGAIKVGVAVFKDLAKPPEKHLVTPFNAKAMVLFPQKVAGKYAALLTANTDLPPSSVGLALFDRKEDMWSKDYWHEWYSRLRSHTLPLERLNSDQVEVGAVPLLTDAGWLLVYAHIQHYYEESLRTFGIEAVLLERDNPLHIIARTRQPLLVPEMSYEKNGLVPNVTFPSGAIFDKDNLHIYYGAADTTCCLATWKSNQLLKSLQYHSPRALKADKPLDHPLLIPDAAHAWESKAVFNPAVFSQDGTTYILYRAMDDDNTSVIGYAKTRDMLTISERWEMPIYVPRALFESKKLPGGNSGCEDPRVTTIDDMLYMCYTAYDGENVPRVAMTSLPISDFISSTFNWKEPVLISPPGIDDKDAALFPEKIDGKYIIIHRIQNSIVFDFVNSLDFDGTSKWLRSIAYIPPRGDNWDSEKIGLCTPPMKTDDGWIILYHGVSKSSHEYRVGAMLLDAKDPSRVIARTPWPILEPTKQYEREGIVNNVVFPCGTALKGDTLYIYYGGADKVTGVATLSLLELTTYLLDNASEN